MRCLDRSRVPWLIQQDLHSTRQSAHDRDAPSLVDGFPFNFDPFCTERINGGVDVVAHQRDLMPDAAFVSRTLSRMDGQLGRGKSEYEPAIARIYVLPSERLPEARAKCLRLRCVPKDMGAGYCHHLKAARIALGYSRPELSRSRMAKHK
jgi:hypothetical protein